jgi:methylmalonyl-CoA mutase
MQILVSCLILQFLLHSLQVYDEGRRIVEEVESMGGMAAAVASGWPKLKIEECAAKRQANIDSGKEVIVGVNKYKLDSQEKIDVLVIDNKEVKAKQLARLEQVRTEVNSQKYVVNLHCWGGGGRNFRK